MNIKRFLFVLLLVAALLSIYACTDTDLKEKPAVFRQVPEIQEIKPQKPIKIKLRRNAKGEYSWEMSGDNVDEIIKTDKRLREAFRQKIK